MASEILSEGTLVRILTYDKRPEFVQQEAEIGNYSAKDGTYECWLTADALEGAYALCTREQIDLIVPEPAAPAPSTSSQSAFSIGDRVRGKETGKMGTVVSVDSDGDPKVLLDGDSEALQRFGSEYEVAERAAFGVGDRVRGRETGKVGVVVSVDEDGDPKVKLDGEKDAQQRFGKEFEVIQKAAFGIGDRVKGKETGKVGRVISVDADGDPKILIDGEEEALQRYAREFIIIEKKDPEKDPEKASNKKDDDQSDESQSDDKKKSKKKKKKKSSSSSSSSKSSSKSRKKKRRSGFGMSMAEQKEEQKRQARKYQKTHSKGADAAFAMMGLK